MSQFTTLIALCLALLAVTYVSADIIVQDNYGNLIGLPTTGGNITGGYTVIGSPVNLSPYSLQVLVNDPFEPNPTTGGTYSTPTLEQFWINNQLGYCGATLINQTFTAGLNGASGVTTVGNYIGSAANPNQVIGVYTYTWTFPVNVQLCINITYNSTIPNDMDRIFIAVGDTPVLRSSSSSSSSSSSTGVRIVGDPQFIGLRGQSYQVHGIDGAVYNIISEPTTQVNARFVFLSQGACPIFEGVPDTNCWSHPGSYLGEISFQQVVNGVNHQALISAGASDEGFESLVIDGKAMKVGASIAYGSFSINYTSAYTATFTTEHFTFELSNSDMFINQAVALNIPMKQLSAHGLLGQTHANKVYSNSIRYIEGSVDDYIIEDDDIFGTDFVYNQFSA